MWALNLTTYLWRPPVEVRDDFSGDVGALTGDVETFMGTGDVETFMGEERVKLPRSLMPSGVLAP